MNKFERFEKADELAFKKKYKTKDFWDIRKTESEEKI